MVLSLAKLRPNDDPTGAVRFDRDRFIAFAFASAHLLVELDLDDQGRIQFASGSAHGLIDGPAEELVGHRLADFVAEDDQAYFGELMRRLIGDGRLSPRMLRLRTARGGEMVLSVGAFKLPERPRVVALAFALPPTSAGPLETGLQHKDDFLRSGPERLATAASAGSDEGLTLMVVDGLARLREAAGPAAADAATARIGAYLRSIAAGGTLAGDLGNGRFGVVQADGVSPEAIQTRIDEILKDSGLTDAASGPGAIHCISIALPADAMSEADAARAMSHLLNEYCASGVGHVTLNEFAETARTMMVETADRIVEARRVIEEGDFTLAYQPIMDLDTNGVHHYEALSRLTGMDGPKGFIDFVESIGLTEDFDLAVTQKLIAAMTALGHRGAMPRIALNLSAKSMMSTRFMRTFNRLFDERPGLAASVMVEMTETVAITDFAAMNRVIEELRDRGHKVCIDDVGSGSTSFFSLYELKADYAKIDGHFVRRAANDPKDMAILRAIAGVSGNLGWTMIGEQIEERHQAMLLRNMGVRLGQGFLYGRPGPRPEPPPAAMAASAQATATAANRNARRQEARTRFE